MTKLFTYPRSLFTVFFLLNQIASSAWAESVSPSYDFDELPSLDFDALLAADVQVTSAIKRLQNMSETAASIYVLTNKEIMHSGVTSVAQALQLVPGMQVRQLDNNQWAITSRSTAGRYSSKLLVMIDGQSIYNPGFAGVYWEALNIPLYDIERIEVIRGQGGLLWGSNATNGVVNIISKHTADTRSTLAQVESGSQLDNRVNFRVGGDLANYSSFRIFAGVEETDASKSSQFILANDKGKKKSIGGRVDLKINEEISLLAQAQYTRIEMGQNLKLANLNTYASEYVDDQYTQDHVQIMSRLEHRLSPVSNQMLQAAISSQRGEQRYYKDDFLITDIDYQMNTLLNGIQFDWGLNYRYNAISIEDSDYISSLDDIDRYNQLGGFVQAQFNIMPDKLKLIFGNKSEKNSFTGWEHQPMGRLLWTPNSSHTFWAAVSQGVRIPSLIEYNARAIGTSAFAIPTVITGGADVDAEKSVSKELGYRYTENSWSIDLSLFHTKARDVIAIEPNIDYVNSLINLDFVSAAKLTTYGGEAVIKWQADELLITELGYSFTSYKYDLPSGTQSAIGYDSYLRQIIAKAHFSVTADQSLFAVYRINDGDAYDTKDYSVLDLSWHWQATPSLALSLTGNNLLYGKHLQYNNTSETYTVATYIEPSYLAGIRVEF